MRIAPGSDDLHEGVMAVEERIRELFATLLQVGSEGIDDRTRPQSLERWDSMQHLILVSGFEEELEIDIDPEEAVDMYQDFGTFKRIVLRKLESRR
jgi:acyl carrier protein